MTELTLGDETAVVAIHEVENEAYRMGYERFSHEPSEPLDDMWFSHYQESAEWANRKAPRLRTMAGAGDRGHGTHTEHRPVITVDFPEDRPADGTVRRSFDIYDRLTTVFRRGAEDKVRGREYGATVNSLLE